MNRALLQIYSKARFHCFVKINGWGREEEERGVWRQRNFLWEVKCQLVVRAHHHIFHRGFGSSDLPRYCGV